ncbi:MAG: GTP-binding protein [Planctomycetes bacterium]|nr:GTP-binding protein [Planctomycetota bacterium]
MTVPVYLVAGFLGSGKTTLMKRLLEHLNARGEKPLVLMNEFGESNIDNELLEGSQAQMRELIDGCICCTSKTELTKTLYDIVTNDAPSSILMEATGLADPVEILDICTLPNLLDRIELRTIVSVVDATRWGKVPQAEALMKRQAKYADILLLNKTDVAGDEVSDEVEKQVRALNERAKLHRTVRAGVDPEHVIGAEGTEVVNDGKDHSHCDHEHDHCEHSADGHVHAHKHDHAHDHYLSVTIKPKGKADKARLNDFLNEGVPGLLRLKGFLQVEGVEPQAILQWTGGHWELIPRPEILKPKPDVLVFIGEDLDRHALIHKLEETGLEFDASEHEGHHDHDHEHAHHHHHEH